MNEKFLLKHLDIKKESSKNNLGIILFKPGFKDKEILDFKKICSENNFNVIKEKSLCLSKNMIISLYKNIFSYSKEDLKFGISWKIETIKYLTSGKSLCFLIEGEEVIEKLTKYKYDLRLRYGKITNPKVLLSKKDFNNKVIKNLVHVSDDCDLQNTLWTLFY